MKKAPRAFRSCGLSSPSNACAVTLLILSHSPESLVFGAQADAGDQAPVSSEHLTDRRGTGLASGSGTATLKCPGVRGAGKSRRKDKTQPAPVRVSTGWLIGECVGSMATSPDAPGRPDWTGSAQVVCVVGAPFGPPVEGIGDACKALGQRRHITVIHPPDIGRPAPVAGSHRVRFAMVTGSVQEVCPCWLSDPF